MNEYFGPLDNFTSKKVSLSNIAPDIHELNLPADIQDLLIRNGVFYIRQIEHTSEYELKQIKGIEAITAEKIRTAFYHYRWEVIDKTKIRNIEQLKAIIDTLARKEEIREYTTDRLILPDHPAFAFCKTHGNTIGDILKRGDHGLFRIRGFGLTRLEQLLHALLEIVVQFDKKIAGTINFPKSDHLDPDLYSQPDLTFREVLIMTLDEFSPRNREILFEYYLIRGAKHGSYANIAAKHGLTTERARQICSKGIRILRHPRRMDCIMRYLDTVWKEKIHELARANDGVITKTQLEQAFANDLPEIYFLLNEVLLIEDIWTLNLKKSDDHYCLAYEFTDARSPSASWRG
jgi:hypothetical protein